jgi:hypothetical protein
LLGFVVGFAGGVSLESFKESKVGKKFITWGAKSTDKAYEFIKGLIFEEISSDDPEIEVERGEDADVPTFDIAPRDQQERQRKVDKDQEI